MLESVSHRWPIAVLTAILVFSASMYVVFKLKPMYAAQTTLILPFTPVSELTSRNDNMTSPQSDPLIVHSYLQIMKDDGICLQIIRQLHLVDVPEFDPPPTAVLHFAKVLETALLGDRHIKVNAKAAQQDRVLQIYKKRLKVFNDGRSLAVDLSFQAENPELAARIANAHASAYLAAQVQYRRAEAETKTAWMEEQVQQNAKDLRAAQVALQLHKPPAGATSAFAADDSADFKFRQSILNSKQSVYQSLLNRQQIMLAEQRYDGSDTRILSPARPALYPSFPNKLLFGAVALMVAVLAGAGLAWAVDLVAQRRRDIADRLHELSLDQLAFIEIPRPEVLPFMGRLRRRRLASFWEKIRKVRSALGPWQNKGLVLAVTPVGTKGGAPLIASSLARVIAASGVRTLHVDLDLRHPSAHTFFGMERREGCGLAECLDNSVLLKEAVRPAPDVACLSLLGSSTLDKGNIDILAGVRIKEMLIELQREYKAIIIDTPPLGVVCDSLVIADLADQVVLVCDERASAINGLGPAVSALRGRSTAIRGVIISSRRQASAKSCQLLDDYATRDRLSELTPFPIRKRKLRQSVAPLAPTVLHPAE